MNPQQFRHFHENHNNFFQGMQNAAGSFFDNVMGGLGAGGFAAAAARGGGADRHHPHQQRTPPASQRAIQQLPTVMVSPEDLVDEANRECCICFEPHELKERVIRLPCAHIYHPACIKDWLCRKNTCPVCRFELPTDDPQYEAGRQERMKSRKPRYARYELDRMPISQLKQLHRRPTRVEACLERSELIQRLIDDEQILLIPTPKPVEYTLSYLQSLGAGKLKRCMADAGVFFHPTDVVEKKDMLEIFRNSGRLCLLPEEGEGENIQNLNNHDVEEHQSSSMVVEDTKCPAKEESQGSTSTASSIQKNNSSTSDSFVSNGHLVETVHEDEEESSSKIPTRQQALDQPVQEMFSSDGESELLSRDPAIEARGSSTIPRHHANGNDNELGASVQAPIDLTNDSDEEQESIVPSNATARTVTDDTFVRTNTNATASEESMAPSTQHNHQNGQDPVPKSNIPQQDGKQSNTEASYGSIEDADGDEAMEDVETSSSSRPPPHADVHASRQSSYSSGPSSDDGSDPFRECTIARLLAIGEECNINLSHCFERSEMIEALRGGGVFDPVQLLLSEETFSGWSMSQLKALATEVDVDLSDCSERDEVVVRMLWKANNGNSPQMRSYMRALAPLATSSLKELRGIAREWQVDISDCIETDEIIGRLIAKRRPA